MPSFQPGAPAPGCGRCPDRGHPKFLLDLDGSGRSLLQQTWDRLNDLIPAERIHVVTGAAHADAIREQLPELTGLFVEPSPRDSMPAIGLAAAVIGARHPDAVIGSFAADHIIEDQVAFAEAIGQAVAVAHTGLVTTIGITPTGPSTGFGYIESGDQLVGRRRKLGPGDQELRGEARCRHRRDRTSRAAPTAGTAGMFVTRTDVLLGHLARLQPGLHAGLARIAAAWEHTRSAQRPGRGVAAAHQDRDRPRDCRAGRPRGRHGGGARRRSPGTTSATSPPCRTSAPPRHPRRSGSTPHGLAICEDGTTIAVVGPAGRHRRPYRRRAAGGRPRSRSAGQGRRGRAQAALAPRPHLSSRVADGSSRSTRRPLGVLGSAV